MFVLCSRWLKSNQENRQRDKLLLVHNSKVSFKGCVQYHKLFNDFRSTRKTDEKDGGHHWVRYKEKFEPRFVEANAPLARDIDQVRKE